MGEKVNDSKGTNVDATQETGEHQTIGGRQSVWYRWTAPSTGRVTIATCDGRYGGGSSFNTLLAVYTGTSVGGGSEEASVCLERRPNPVVEGGAGDTSAPGDDVTHTSEASCAVSARSSASPSALAAALAALQLNQ